MSIFGNLNILDDGRYYSTEDFGDSIAPSCLEDGRELTLLTLGSTALVETFASLESLQGLVYDRLQAGGLTKNEAGILNNSIKGVLNNASKTKVERNIVSVEAFDTKSGRTNQTYLAMESISEILGGWWKKIKQFIRSWIAKILDFDQKYISAIGRLPGACDKLIKKINDNPDRTKLEEPTLEISPSLLRNLTKEETTFKAESIKAGLQDLEGFVKQYNSENKLGEKISKVVTDLVGLTDYTKLEDIAKVVSELKDGAEDKEFTGTDTRYSSKSTRYCISTTVLGQKRFVCKLNHNKPVNEGGLITGVVLSFEDWKKDLKFSDSYKIAPIPRDGMEDLLGVVKDLAKVINETQPELRKYENEIKKLLDDADKIYARINDSKESEGGNKGKVKIAESTYGKDKFTPGTPDTPMSLGERGSKAKYDSVKVVESFLKSMVGTAQCIVSGGTFAINQAGASAKAAYDFTLKSFNNLKE